MPRIYNILSSTHFIHVINISFLLIKHNLESMRMTWDVSNLSYCQHCNGNPSRKCDRFYFDCNNIFIYCTWKAYENSVQIDKFYFIFYFHFFFTWNKFSEKKNRINKIGEEKNIYFLNSTNRTKYSYSLVIKI